MGEVKIQPVNGNGSVPEDETLRETSGRDTPKSRLMSKRDTLKQFGEGVMNKYANVANLSLYTGAGLISLGV
ncbi:hypothetical protein TrST_g12081 [Triparma strigata]|uniref:Uncharacterized protein n=1 Tax=Triparma strigata TaxID=1606541 RepID=A0A9W7EWJ6_9STRA|nr:hypothetical protein TrST_g12081 [Triparma strigata]